MTLRTPTRRGNAIVIALGMFTVAAVLIGTAADGSVVTSKAASQGVDHQRALAALDAVLARREVMIVERAGQGDPVEIARWNQNYGVDFVGDAEVRWKIEPVRTAPRDASGNPVHHIVNPSPDANWTVPTDVPIDDATGEPLWQANDTNFMFRIAGEARVGVDPNGGTGVNQAGNPVPRPAAVVQGARYTSVLKEPLFRYVIFYAAKGSKGDLELTHAAPVNIQGSVHTNGALYLGGGLKVNDRIARVGPLDGSFLPAYTAIGPDVEGNKVRVNGVDGIFRLSKPLMFSIINGWMLSGPDSSVSGLHGDPDISTGADPVNWTAGGSYDISESAFPNDPRGVTFGTNIGAGTADGRLINPYRVLSGSGAVTENPLASTSDKLVTINGVPIRGVALNAAESGDSVANDARDADRPENQAWTVLSPQGTAPGFDGKARTKQTGQNVKSLPERMRNRALEAQRLSYLDFDGDEATDEHELARPLFVTADGRTTTDFPRSEAGLGPFPVFGGGVQVVEEPGQYLRYALGNDQAYMVRYDTGEGWFIRERDGDRPPESATPGLIIRERPAPSVAHWPGDETAVVVSPTDPRWVPYAYGKHWYPRTFRFTVADIAEECAPETARPWNYNSQDNPLHPSRINTSVVARALSYAPGGRLAFSAAQNASGVNSNFYNGWNNNYQRKPYYYSQNWRFVHLGQHQIDDTVNGLKVTVFNDRPSGIGSQSLVGGPEAVNGAIIPVTAPTTTTAVGPIIAIPRVNNGTDGIQTGGSTPTSLVSSRRSVRFEGFITAESSNLYRFSATTGSNQKVRVWVDGVLAFSNWAENVSLDRPLTEDRAVPIQIDYYNDGNNTPSLDVQWATIQPTLGTPTTIPTEVFNPPKANPGIPRANFTSAIVRIDQPFDIPGPDQKKAGLMIRDGSGGMSPLLNGAAQYAFIGFSPQRGVFTERRAVRHLQEQRTVGSYYIGNGTGPNGPVDDDGQIIDNPDSVTTVSRTARLTQTDLTPKTNNAATYQTSTSTSGISWSSQPTPYSGPMSKSVGGGKTWTILQGFSIGRYVGSRTQRIDKRARQNAYQVLTVALSGHVAPFDDIDGNNDTTYGTPDGRDNNYGRRVRIFKNPTGIGIHNGGGVDNDRIDTNILAPGALPANDGRWYLYRGSPGNRTEMRRRFNGGYAYGPWVTGATVTQNMSTGDNGTVWRTSSKLEINKSGTVVNATIEDLETITGLNLSGTGTGGVRNGTSAPTTGFSPNPTAPANSACPAPTGAPPNVTIPDFVNGGNGRTFSIERSNITIVFDLNSWISNSQTWLNTAVAQYVPTRGAAWAASWVGNPTTTWPLTQSWRPDVDPGRETHSTVEVNPTGDAGRQEGGYRLDDDVAIPVTSTALWLRAIQAGSTLSFDYSLDKVTWTNLGQSLDISGWGSHLLIGPALQSGDANVVTTASFSDMSITTTLPTPNDVIDATDWDTDASGEDIMGRYLASQYQVWWGTREITEDFFTYTDPTTGRRLAGEEWIFNPREFWSQSRWWDHRDAADADVRVSKDEEDEDDPQTAFSNTRMREAYAKTTLLTLDLEALQNYLRTRLLSEALADRLPGHMDSEAVTDDHILAQRFSGLIYAVRTNRFPWNPNAHRFLKEQRLAIRDDDGTILGYTADTDGINPWSPSYGNKLPNSVPDMDSEDTPEIGNNASLRSGDGWLDAPQDHLLQPYAATDLLHDPPLKPQQFHHGVRLVNGSSIHWGYAGTPTSAATRSIGGSGTTAFDWRWSATPAFGTSKTSIVSPSALYVQGNLNVDKHETTRGADTKMRFTPLAIMGDSINLLSNAFQDSNAQIAGLTVTNDSPPGHLSGSGTLANAYNYLFASDTEYNTAIATHNIPSNRDRVAEGQASSFTDTTLFLENWNNRKMAYLGSLVVMDSRRYSNAFLLDTYKTYGQTPFGIVDNSGAWLARFNSFQYSRPNWQGIQVPFRTGLYGAPLIAASDWVGYSPAVTSEPNRVYQFNYDLLTEEGTPPFAPFGVSTSGVGGWARIIK